MKAHKFQKLILALFLMSSTAMASPLERLDRLAAEMGDLAKYLLTKSKEGETGPRLSSFARNRYRNLEFGGGNLMPGEEFVVLRDRNEGNVILTAAQFDGFNTRLSEINLLIRMDGTGVTRTIDAAVEQSLKMTKKKLEMAIKETAKKYPEIADLKKSIKDRTGQLINRQANHGMWFKGHGIGLSEREIDVAALQELLTNIHLQFATIK